MFRRVFMLAAVLAAGLIPAGAFAQTAGAVNGWMAVAGNELIVPVGGANPAAVIAYRLP